MDSCLTPLEIEALRSGRASSELKTRAQAHVRKCQACLASLAEGSANNQFFENVKQALNTEKPAKKRSGHTTYVKSGASASGNPFEVVEGYEILREIHRGGQGVVYQAVQITTKKKVAVKVMLESAFADARHRARFEREVRILAALNHPNIVAVLDRGITKRGAYFYAMNYVPGLPLDQYVAEYREKHPDSREDLGELLKLFIKIADAVNAAHLRGIVHRDLKPSNIRIDPSGEPHILDFGLGRLPVAEVTDESHPRPVTITGQFIGSLPWASPEQAEGIPSKIDIRTDVYSLGVVLYQILTGKFPYEVVGTMRDVLENILNAEPTPPSRAEGLCTRPATSKSRWRRWRARNMGINQQIEAIVLKALQKNREQRYQSAGDLARELADYLAGRPISALPRGGARSQVFSRPVYVGALIVICITFSVMAMLWRSHRYAFPGVGVTQPKEHVQAVSADTEDPGSNQKENVTSSELVRSDTNKPSSTEFSDEKTAHPQKQDAAAAEGGSFDLGSSARSKSQREKGDAEARVESAWVRISEEDLEQALRVIHDRAALASGEKAKIRYDRAKAIERLYRVATKKPKDLGVQHRLADACRRLRDTFETQESDYLLLHSAALIEVHSLETANAQASSDRETQRALANAYRELAWTTNIGRLSGSWLYWQQKAVDTRRRSKAAGFESVSDRTLFYDDLARLNSALMEENRLDDAMAVTEELIGLLENRSKQPSGSSERLRLHQAYVSYAELLQRRDPEKALHYVSLAVDYFSASADFDDNGYAAFACQARFLRLKGLKAQAIESERRRLEYAQRIKKTNPENPYADHRLGETYGDLANLAFEDGDVSTALSYSLKAYDEFDSLVHRWPTNTAFIGVLVQYCEQVARFARMLNDTERAREYSRKAAEASAKKNALLSIPATPTEKDSNPSKASSKR